MAVSSVSRGDSGVYAGTSSNNAEQGDTGKKRRSLSALFWGRAAQANLATRIAGLVFVMAAIASMSFCQLGFWPVCVIDDKPVYLMLILAPLFMGALAFGPLAGGILGLFAGTVLFVHQTVFPLDWYEYYFMTPLHTFVLLTFLGVLSGWVFSLAFRVTQRGPRRLALIAAACVALSFVASGLMVVCTLTIYGFLGGFSLAGVREYLLNSPLGIVVQALIDAVLIVALCWLAEAAMNHVVVPRSDRTLLTIFSNWMLVVACVVFMLSSATIFSTTTAQLLFEARQSMESEVEYLKIQANSLDGNHYDVLLDGYSTELDGSVTILNNEGTIIATNDDELLPMGKPFFVALGYSIDEGEDIGEYSREWFDQSLNSDDPLDVIQVNDPSGALSLDFVYLTVAQYDGGYTTIMQTSKMVYADRFGTMVSSTALAISLIAAMAVLAAILLNRVVGRRFDETNVSLKRITQGNLNERVRVNDTREFTSLSTGINTTVSALKDTIAEVEQRNAQDLATAKAIQESALPREFPPFPDIDRFDIYASMKTAKEVGGDFYDFFLIDGGLEQVNKLGFVMADVSGKGIPAALFMMTAKTQIRNYMESGMPVNEAVDAANHRLCIGNDAGMFVTVWVGVLDYDTGELNYVNAGHNPPLVYHEGSWEWIKDVSGMPLGLFDGLPYDVYTLQLEAGDMLYAYTDGVTEAMDSEGNLFGEDRLMETLYNYVDFNPRSVGVGVRRAITDYTLDCEQSDDITMLILKYGVPPEHEAIMILPADDKQLVHVWNFIHEELRRRGAPHSARSPLDIAAEELFVNVCHYAYPDATPDNPGEVRISFEYDANPPSLTVTIADDGVPYNPLAKPDAVTPDDIEDVPIGGLGILMAKKSVDEMEYRYESGSNITTFKKSW